MSETPDAPNPPIQVTEHTPTGEGNYGVLTRVRLGKAAMAFSAVEIPAGVVSLITDSPWPIIGATLAGAWTAGETAHSLHNSRRQPASELGGFKGWLVKPDKWKKS